MNVVAADPRDQFGHILNTFRLVSVSTQPFQVYVAICGLKDLQLHLHFLTYYLSLWGIFKESGGIGNVNF